jgi:hypothetical protein
VAGVEEVGVERDKGELSEWRPVTAICRHCETDIFIDSLGNWVHRDAPQEDCMECDSVYPRKRDPDDRYALAEPQEGLYCRQCYGSGWIDRHDFGGEMDDRWIISGPDFVDVNFVVACGMCGRFDSDGQAAALYAHGYGLAISWDYPVEPTQPPYTERYPRMVNESRCEMPLCPNVPAEGSSMCNDPGCFGPLGGDSPPFYVLTDTDEKEWRAGHEELLRKLQEEIRAIREEQQ